MFILKCLHLIKKRLSFGIVSLGVSAIVLFALISITGCGNNSVTAPTNTTTFSISQQNSVQGTQFLARPSVDVKVTKIISGIPTQPFYDTVINQNPNYTFSKDSSYIINTYTGVTTGQKWTFNFTGSLVSGGAAFNTTTNYTVP